VGLRSGCPFCCKVVQSPYALSPFVVTDVVAMLPSLVACARFLTAVYTAICVIFASHHPKVTNMQGRRLL